METINGIEVLFKPANRDFSGRWHQFNPSKQVLPTGFQKDPDRRALTEDLIFEQDFPILLRDGVTTIRADIFRPVGSDDKPVPAMLAWSPYGKQGNGFQTLDRVPFRAGIPKHWTSDLEKYEAPDPAEWCPRGYAVVNVDGRGVFDSDGDMCSMGEQEGRDGYDTVECIASQTWCNGAIGFVGNSYLGAIQWHIAAQQPPHLKAIAPWEGFSDLYREILGRGGIPNPAFVDYRSGYNGKNRQEDTGAMIRAYPLYNPYWTDKTAKLAQINVPIYALASWSTGLHTEGSIRGFLFSSSKDKWLRIHHTQEWHDLYQKSANDDLQKFFDRYLYGKDNGWEETPRVRHSLLGFNGESVVDRPESAYPPDYVEHRTFFLDCESGTLNEQAEAPKKESLASYQSDSWDDDGAHFIHKFETYTELIGFSQATLYMSSDETDDLDVYVVLRKLGVNGEPLLHITIPRRDLPKGTTATDVPDVNIFKYVGPNGRLRASQRQLSQDPTITTAQTAMLAPATAWHAHDKEDKVEPGKIVRLDIPLWPSGIVFQPGESIRLEVKGHEVCLPEFPALYRVPENLNRGKHVVHSGGPYPSSVTMSLASGGLGRGGRKDLTWPDETTD